MKAAVVHALGDLRLEQIPVPEVPAGSIRLKVQSCAICGTDIRIYRKGDHRAQYPVVIGHEIAGTVDAVGRGASGIHEGERVCVAPGHGCGECRTCRSGFPNVCTRPFPSLGYKVNGGFEEYFAVPENIFRLGFVNAIPSGLSFAQASMSEIIACCLNAQQNTPTRPGDTVLVIGSGPAGIIHSQLARRAGARRVLVTQRSRQRLEETAGEGADVIYVCAPSAEAQETALQLAAPRGRINFFGGLPRGANHISADANIVHYRELFIGGASSSRPVDNREALRLLEERAIDPDRLVTHTFAIDDIVRAFDVAESRQGIKVVVNF
jgi:L-iditol 2-dehydrogenase